MRGRREQTRRAERQAAAEERVAGYAQRELNLTLRETRIRENRERLRARQAANRAETRRTQVGMPGIALPPPRFDPGRAGVVAAIRERSARGNLLSEDEFYTWAREEGRFGANYDNYLRFVARKGRDLEAAVGTEALRLRSDQAQAELRSAGQAQAKLLRREARREAAGRPPHRVGVREPGAVQDEALTYPDPLDPTRRLTAQEMVDRGYAVPTHPGVPGPGFLARFEERVTGPVSGWGKDLFTWLNPTGESPEEATETISEAAQRQGVPEPVANEVAKMGIDLAALPVRVPVQVIESFVGIPGFTAYALDDPVGAGKAMVDATLYAVQHPLERPGDIALMILGAKGLVSGRLANVTRAVIAREGVAQIARAAWRPASSTGALTRVPRWVDERLDNLLPNLGADRRLSQRDRQLRASIAAAEPEVLRADAGRLVIKPSKPVRRPAREIARQIPGRRRGEEKPPRVRPTSRTRLRDDRAAQSEAIRAVLDQTTPLERKRYFEEKLQATQGLERMTGARRRLAQLVRANNIVIKRGLVEGEPGNVRIAAKEPELQNLYDRVFGSATRSEDLKLALGLITPETALARKAAPGEFMRGAEYGRETVAERIERVGEQRGVVQATRELEGKTVDALDRGNRGTLESIDLTNGTGVVSFINKETNRKEVAEIPLDQLQTLRARGRRTEAPGREEAQLSSPIRTRAREVMLEAGIPEAEVNAVISAWDEYTKVMGEANGYRPGDWWEKKLTDFELGGEVAANALYQRIFPTDARMLHVERSELAARAADPATVAAEQYAFVEREAAMFAASRADYWPKSIRTRRQFLGLIDEFRTRLFEGWPYAKDWYPDSGKTILEHAGGDTRTADAIAALTALLSPQRAIVPNLGLALRTFSEWRDGIPPRIGDVAQRANAERVLRQLDAGEELDFLSVLDPDSLPKVRRFYANLLKHIDYDLMLSKGFTGREVTVDGWMGAAAHYGDNTQNVSMTLPKIEFVERLVQHLADRYGIEPEAAQAAIWASIKAENDKVTAKLYKTDKEQAIYAAGASFEDAISTPEFQLRIAFEAASNQIPGYESWPVEAKQAFLNENSDALLGALHEAGYIGRITDEGIGIYRNLAGEVETNPAAALEIPVGARPNVAYTELGPGEAQLATDIAAIIGTVLQQEGVGWIRGMRAKVIADRTVYRIEAGRPLTAEELRGLEDNLPNGYVSQTTDGALLATLDPDAILNGEKDVRQANAEAFRDEMTASLRSVWPGEPEQHGVTVYAYAHRGDFLGRAHQDVASAGARQRSPALGRLYDRFSADAQRILERYSSDAGRAATEYATRAAGSRADRVAAARGIAAPRAPPPIPAPSGRIRPAITLYQRGREAELTPFDPNATANESLWREVYGELSGQAITKVWDEIPEVFSEAIATTGGFPTNLATRNGILDHLGLNTPEGIARVDRALEARGVAPPGRLTQTRGGVVRGATTFVDDLRARIQLLEKPDASTALEELLHVARRDLQGEHRRVIEDWLQKELDEPLVNLDNLSVAGEEMFARAGIQYFRTGKTPNPRLKAAFQVLKKALSALYRKAKELNVNITPEVRQVFDELFGGPGGRGVELGPIAGPAYGTYKAEVPVGAVVPTRLAKGRKLGFPRRKTVTQKPLTFEGAAVGRVGDVVRLSANEHLSVLGDQARLQAWQDAKAVAMPAEDMVTAVRSGLIKERNVVAVRMRSGTLGPDVKEFETRWFGREGGAFDVVSERVNINDLETLELAGEVDPRRVQFFDNSVVGLKRLDITPAGLARQTGRAINQAAKFSLLFMKGPGYLLPQYPGLVFMAAMHQGIRAPLTPVKARQIIKHLTDEERLRLRRMGGVGVVRSIDPGAGPFARLGAINDAVGNFYAKLMDDFWREGAVIYEAGLRGYTTPAHFKRLAERSTVKGSQEAADALAIHDAVNEAFGRFDTISDFEKKYISDYIFFYPWIRASTIYALRLPINHPVKAAVLGEGGTAAQAKTFEDLVRLIMSEGKTRGEAERMTKELMKMTPGIFVWGDRVINPAAAAVLSGPQDVRELVEGIMDGNIGKILTVSTTPYESLIGAVFNYNLFTQQPYPEDMGLGERLVDVAEGLSPYATAYRRFTGDQGVLYTYTPGEIVGQLWGGGISPRGLNVEGLADVTERRVNEALARPERATRDIFDARNDALQLAIERGILRPGQRFPPTVRTAFNRQAERKREQAIAKEALGEDEEGKQLELTPRDKLRIDYKLLAKWRLVPPQRYQAAVRWLESAPDAEVEKAWDRQSYSKDEPMYQAIYATLSAVGRELRDAQTRAGQPESEVPNLYG